MATEKVDITFNPSLIIKEKDVVSELETDFDYILKKEICDDVLPVEGNVDSEEGCCRNLPCKVSSNLEASTSDECISRDNSEDLTEDQLECCPEQFHFLQVTNN